MPQSSSDEDNALRDIRTVLGLTQAQIAERIRISRSLWSALENRQRPLTVALLNRMQDRLELTDEQVLVIRGWWGESHLSLSRAQPESTAA